MITEREENGFMEDHAILSEGLEDQLKAVEWARAEQKKILKASKNRMKFKKHRKTEKKYKSLEVSQHAMIILLWRA